LGTLYLATDRTGQADHFSKEPTGMTMAIQIEANYAKKLGLPNYSSHAYSVTVRTTVQNLEQVEAESARLYALLQGAVDREIQNTGFVPEGNGNGVHRANGSNGSECTVGASRDDPDRWQCSGKQRDLIMTIIEEQRLSQEHVEWMAQERFGRGLRMLSRPETSVIISKLLTR
jgi:hypothetical protein